MRFLKRFYVALVMLFLYLPIGVLILYSFNASKSRSVWSGFSLRWYRDLFSNELILTSLYNTIVVALCASVIAAILGTAAAMGIYSIRNRWFKSMIMNVTYMPILNPEIVMGVSLLLLFVSVNQIGAGISAATGIPMPELNLGYLTLVIAHVTFCTPYVILNVLPKLRQMDKYVYEAALDLGCSPVMAFFKVIIPEIMPGMATGFLMALTYSVDDFIISYFVSSATSQTLPVTIGAMVRKRISPEINALSAIIFVVVLVVLLIINLSALRKERLLQKKQGGAAG
ncbi:MAG: ABC transporter permease [Angelakisella sp.]|jgi:spermidine/putrescine transport system permease protein|nr:ABC transporter permease [Angelakisella sp.]